VSYAAILAAAFVCVQPGVIDGDTLRCQDGQRVRLWGIDSPERHHPTGPAATRALTAIVGGQTLHCEPKGKSYSRVVARCFVGRRDLAGEMVRQGWAVDWPKFSGGFYSEGRR